MNEELIAPCGMNCGICTAFLGGQKTKCPGCRIRKKNCAFLKKTCEKLSKEKTKYCFECKKFPCIQLNYGGLKPAEFVFP